MQIFSDSSKEHVLIISSTIPNKHIIENIIKKYDVEILVRFPSEDIPDVVWMNTTVLITLSNFPPRRELCKNLKLVQVWSAGVNRLPGTPIWEETDVPITNSSGVFALPIAEWVIGQMISHNTFFPRLLEHQKNRSWSTNSDFNKKVGYEGQRLGVLGYGAIGRQTARVAKALGMDVIAYTASPRKSPEAKKDDGYFVPGTGDPEGVLPSAWYSGHSKESLHHFLGQDIDVLLIAVPLTPQTKHLLGSEEFSLLGEKRNALIVNIARGDVLKQDDLIAALKKDVKDGGLRGAALDVTDPEPLPKESELWNMEHVTITPHMSGFDGKNRDRSLMILDTNLGRLRDGKELLNLVDRKKGY